MPTILHLTASPVPGPLDGQDLVPLLEKATPLPPRVLFSDTWSINHQGELAMDRLAAFDGDAKVVLDRKENSATLLEQGTVEEAPPRASRSAPDGPLLGSALRYLEETAGGPAFDER